MSVTLQFAPAGLERELAAAYVGLSVSTFEKAVREAQAPRPRKLGDRRVVWLRTELEDWLLAAPVSDQSPPENTGARKPRTREPRPRKRGVLMSALPASPNAQPAA